MEGAPTKIHRNEGMKVVHSARLVMLKAFSGRLRQGRTEGD
jgi:hypothetical protein